MMKFLTENIIEMNKEFSDLDIFTLDFVNSIKDYTNYVLISGYVSILLGRSRSSEDIDIIIPHLDKDTIKKIITNIGKNNFYCLNTESEEEMIEMLNDKLAIRFAKVGEIIPNMEIKFAKTNIDNLALKDKITVIINDKKLFISNLELQIAFKEKVLKSPKDIEDALHIRSVAQKNINNEKLKFYEVLLNDFC
jgi:hypothetical protein